MIAWTMMPTASETWLPNNKRLSVSRPSSSAPSAYPFCPGPASMNSTCCLMGSAIIPRCTSSRDPKCPPDSRDAEHRLHDHRTRNEERERRPQSRDDRDQRVLQYVPDHDEALRQPLRPRGSDEVLPDGLERAGAGEARRVGDRKQRECDHRHDQVIVDAESSRG